MWLHLLYTKVTLGCPARSNSDKTVTLGCPARPNSDTKVTLQSLAGGCSVARSHRNSTDCAVLAILNPQKD
eukprot:636619-Prorocentrum_minimum.AAC.2